LDSEKLANLFPKKKAYNHPGVISTILLPGAPPLKNLTIVILLPLPIPLPLPLPLPSTRPYYPPQPEKTASLRVT
jgi:hypothetical protein